MHWPEPFIVIGCDKQGRALLAGPKATKEEAQELAVEKLRDPSALWVRAFTVGADRGYDRVMSSTLEGDQSPAETRAEQFPGEPEMVAGDNDLEVIAAAREGRPVPKKKKGPKV